MLRENLQGHLQRISNFEFRKSTTVPEELLRESLSRLGDNLQGLDSVTPNFLSVLYRSFIADERYKTFIEESKSIGWLFDETATDIVVGSTVLLDNVVLVKMLAAEKEADINTWYFKRTYSNIFENAVVGAIGLNYLEYNPATSKVNGRSLIKDSKMVSVDKGIARYLGGPILEFDQLYFGANYQSPYAVAKILDKTKELNPNDAYKIAATDLAPFSMHPTLYHNEDWNPN